jgi:hypothetical protein
LNTLGPPHTRALTENEQRLDVLLKMWNSVGPLVRGSGAFGDPNAGGGEGGWSQMPIAWRMSSYPKLEIMLRYMAHAASGGSHEFKAWHASLCNYYGRGSWTKVVRKRRDKFTKKRYDREVVDFVPGRFAKLPDVLEALAWIEGHIGEIDLPQDFLGTDAFDPAEWAA